MLRYYPEHGFWIDLAIDRRKRHVKSVSVMPDAIQTLIALQERDKKEIEELTNDILAKKQRLNERKARFEALTEAIKLLSGESGTSTSAPTKVPKVPKYVEMPLTDAVLDVIERHGAAPGLFIPEIMEHLASEGYKSESDNFYPSVYSTVMRWVNRGKATKGVRDGKRSFVRANPF